VRHVCNHLDRLFKMLVVYLVQHQSKDQLKRGSKNMEVQVERDGVFYETPESGFSEKTEEMFEPDPLASEISKTGVKIAESNLGSVHRNIGEDKSEEHGG